MMCEFQSLYYGHDGYVARCKQCGYYQLAFISSMLTLTEYDYQAFYKLIKYKCNEENYSFSEHSKSVIIQTPSESVCILLTKGEANRLCEILEEADTEAKAQALIRLFNA